MGDRFLAHCKYHVNFQQEDIAVSVLIEVFQIGGG